VWRSDNEKCRLDRFPAASKPKQQVPPFAGDDRLTQRPGYDDEPKTNSTEKAQGTARLGNEDEEGLFAYYFVHCEEQVFGGFTLGDEAAGAGYFCGFG